MGGSFALSAVRNSGRLVMRRLVAAAQDFRTALARSRAFQAKLSSTYTVADLGSEEMTNLMQSTTSNLLSCDAALSCAFTLIAELIHFIPATLVGEFVEQCSASLEDEPVFLSEDKSGVFQHSTLGTVGVVDYLLKSGLLRILSSATFDFAHLARIVTSSLCRAAPNADSKNPQALHNSPPRLFRRDDLVYRSKSAALYLLVSLVSIEEPLPACRDSSLRVLVQELDRVCGQFPLGDQQNNLTEESKEDKSSNDSKSISSSASSVSISGFSSCQNRVQQAIVILESLYLMANPPMSWRNRGVFVVPTNQIYECLHSYRIQIVISKAMQLVFKEFASVTLLLRTSAEEEKQDGFFTQRSASLSYVEYSRHFLLRQANLLALSMYSFLNTDNLARVILNPTKRHAEISALRSAPAWNPSQPAGLM